MSSQSNCLKSRGITADSTLDLSSKIKVTFYFTWHEEKNTESRICCSYNKLFVTFIRFERWQSMKTGGAGSSLGCLVFYASFFSGKLLLQSEKVPLSKMHHFGALNFAAPWALPFQTENTNQYSKIHVKLFWFHPSIKKAKKTKEKSLLPLLCTVISAKGLGSPPGLHSPDSSEIHPLSPCSGTACSSPKPRHTLSLTQTGTPDVPLLAPAIRPAATHGPSRPQRLSMQEKRTDFYMANFSRDFTRGWHLCSKASANKEDPGENLYLKRKFKSFLVISDTILLPCYVSLFRTSFFLT